MRELPTLLINEIRAVEFEYTAIPREILEKDAHLTDALREISLLPKFEVATLKDRRQKNTPQKIQLPIELVFAGGTCLTKAHGTIDRMSEDIDFKLYLHELPKGYEIEGLTSKAARFRKIHSEIETRLKNIGFTFSNDNPSTKNPLIRDSRSYYELLLDYASSAKTNLDKIEALRPKLKLEIVASLLPLSYETKSIGYLHRKIIGLNDESSFELDCIDLKTTLAEKVLSFLRRHAWFWSGNQRGAFDDALVRHIYDVSKLTLQHPELANDTIMIFKELTLLDAKQFGNQYPEFQKTPFKILQDTLQQTRNEKKAFIKQNFEQKLIPLLTNSEHVIFEESFDNFYQVAKLFLAE